MEKKNKGLIFLIIILILIVIGLVGYIVYDKFYLKEETNNNTEVKEENILKQLNVTDKKVNTLFNNVATHFDPYDSGKNKYLAYLYQHDSLEVKDMDANYINGIGLMLALDECSDKCEKENSSGKIISTISKDQIDKKILYVFGDIKYDYVSSIRINNANYKYDKSKNVYQAKIVKEDPDLSNSQYDDIVYDSNYYDMITRAEMDNNNIYIYTKVAFDKITVNEKNGKQTYKVFSDYNKKNSIYEEKYSSYDIIMETRYFTSHYNNMFEYLDEKLSTYKLTFTKEKGIYHFKKVEKI